MTERITPSNRVPDYELRLKGHLDARWAAWFDGLTLTHETDGTTSLRGPIVDQATLHGLLQKVRDLGVPLISVTQTEPDQPDLSPASLPDALTARDIESTTTRRTTAIDKPRSTRR